MDDFNSVVMITSADEHDFNCSFSIFTCSTSGVHNRLGRADLSSAFNMQRTTRLSYTQQPTTDSSRDVERATARNTNPTQSCEDGEG